MGQHLILDSRLVILLNLRELRPHLQVTFIAFASLQLSMVWLARMTTGLIPVRSGGMAHILLYTTVHRQQATILLCRAMVVGLIYLVVWFTQCHPQLIKTTVHRITLSLNQRNFLKPKT